jgi:hypothetical protein
VARRIERRRRRTPRGPQGPGAYNVDYRKYWVDEQNGKIFCLVEAPDAETAVRVHQEAHGLFAQAIYPVAEAV